MRKRKLQFPTIQEQILNLEAIDGPEPLTERSIREVVGMVDWGQQREPWNAIIP